MGLFKLVLHKGTDEISEMQIVLRKKSSDTYKYRMGRKNSFFVQEILFFDLHLKKEVCIFEQRVRHLPAKTNDDS